MRILPFLLLFALSCNPGGDDVDSTQELPTTAATGIPVYNQAYQENYVADNLDNILAEARDAYVLLDPFSDDKVAASVSAIKAGGNQVAAYISIGTGETYRDDYAALKPYLVSKPWGEWPDEYFVKQAVPEVVALMKARIDRLADWGFDWVEFDNMDWVFDEDYRQEYGIETSEEAGTKYARTLCAYVHERGMKCMAKNTVDGFSDFDGVLYESYSDDKDWWDVSGAKSFVAAGKLVIINHYDESNCGRVYTDYSGEYGPTLSFICEDSKLKQYVHFGK